MNPFPPNSPKADEPKKVEQVTSVAAVRRKRPLGTRVRELLIAGSARAAGQYVMDSVVVPTLKELLFESFESAARSMIFGDVGRRSRGPSAPPSTHPAFGRVDYGAQSRSPVTRPPAPPAVSRSSRSRFDFGEIVLSHRTEAEDVIERLFDLTERYGEATVVDLYSLVGLKPEHTDVKWGWTDMRGSKVGRLRDGGYVLQLPSPGPLR